MVIMTTPASASEPRTTRANNSREQILDAYEHLLVQAGERAATLDAVAAQAKVSKGGLLYHFGSKKALFQALLDRTRTYADEDLEKIGGQRLLHQHLNLSGHPIRYMPGCPLAVGAG